MKRLLATLLDATSALAAHAATLQPDKSDLSFTFKQMGVPVDGKFKKFEAQLDFDAISRSVTANGPTPPWLPTM